MGGSPDIPKPDDKYQKEQLDLMTRQTDLAEKQAQDAEAAAKAAANAPKPLAPPPPPTQDSGDLQSAEDSARIAAARRVNSGKNTLFAGDTGGYSPAAATPKTLLG